MWIFFYIPLVLDWGSCMIDTWRFHWLWAWFFFNHARIYFYIHTPGFHFPLLWIFNIQWESCIGNKFSESIYALSRHTDRSITHSETQILLALRKPRLHLDYLPTHSKQGLIPGFLPPHSKPGLKPEIFTYPQQARVNTWIIYLSTASQS